MILSDKDKVGILADEVEIVDSFLGRFRGLMFRREFEEGEALLFRFSEPRKFGVHTFFVFFPIDLVYLNEDFQVLEIRKRLSPWKRYTPEVKASFLVELPGGVAGSEGIEVGDELKLEERKNY